MDQDTSALIEDLKTRLQSVEEASEEYRKQVEGLQLRLAEASTEHNKVEEQLHEEQERTEGLENEKKDALRQKRELENIYEAERASFMKIQESAQNREDELREIIDRLKESLSEKDLPGSPLPGGDDGRLSRNTSSPSLEAGGPHFAPSSALSRSNSRNNSKILLQKDKVIESLRFELAEAQVKLVEMENMGGGRMQELEKTLLETRMANARLMEDNESFQLLLSEKTLNGDFVRQDILQTHSPMATDQAPARDQRASTLEDELALSSSVESEAAGPSEEVPPKDKRVMQAEISTLKDQNKALTVYINKIIERILQRQGGFENILSTADDANDDPRPSLAPAPDMDKALPPPPPKDALGTSPSGPLGTSPSAPSFLERTKSLIGTGRPKPTTQPSQPSITEDPNSAPSIPLARATSVRRSVQYDRRATVDWGTSAASVISNMTRGANTSEVNPASPGIVSQRNSFFGFGAAGRTPSGSVITRPGTAVENVAPADMGGSPTKRERQAALDALEGESTPPTSVSDAPSPPRSTTSGDFRGGPSVMMGSKMRPLRLVQEKEEDDAARKAANRASWIPAGWFGNKDGAAPSKPAVD